MRKVYIYREFASIRDAFKRLSELNVLPFMNVYPMFGLQSWATTLAALDRNGAGPKATLVYRRDSQSGSETLIWGAPDGHVTIKVVDAIRIVWALQGMVMPDTTNDVLQPYISDGWLVWDWHPSGGDVTTDMDSLLKGEGGPLNTDLELFRSVLMR